MIIPNIWKYKTCSKPPTSVEQDSHLGLILVVWKASKFYQSHVSISNPEPFVPCGLNLGIPSSVTDHIIIWGMCQTFPSQTIEFWNAWCTHSTTFYHNSAQSLKWGVTEYFQDQVVKLTNRKRTIDDLNLWWRVTEEIFFVFVFVFYLCQNTRDQPSRNKETNNHAFHI